MRATDIQSRPQHLLRGITLIVATGFVISIQDVVFKLFSTDLSLWQIFTIRAILAFPLLLLLAWSKGRLHEVLTQAIEKWPLIRSLFLAVTFMAFYAALPFLSMSTVGAANYTAPIFVTLLAACLIREAVGIRGWLAVFIGFAGVIALLKPGTDAFSPIALLPLLGAIFYAMAHIVTRSKCQSLRLVSLALSLNIIMLCTGIAMSVIIWLWQPADEWVTAYPNVLGGWSSVSTYEWLVLVLLAVMVVVIGMMLAGAYQAAPPSIVATFEYSYLLFVALWDYFFFTTSPTATSLLGITLIIIAGLMAIRRE